MLLLALAKFKWMVYAYNHAYVTFKTNIRADLFSTVAVQSFRSKGGASDWFFKISCC